LTDLQNAFLCIIDKYKRQELFTPGSCLIYGVVFACIYSYRYNWILTGSGRNSMNRWCTFYFNQYKHGNYSHQIIFRRGTYQYIIWALVMARRLSVIFSHSNLLLWNHWTDLNQTCQKNFISHSLTTKSEKTNLFL
jgi:hypothetical protein